MFLEICLAIACGVASGIFTGLIPGVHVNLVTAVVVSSVGGLLVGIAPLIIAIFIVSLALTHSFLDSIPSIYLGAPDESQVFTVLPGHKFVLEGKGHLAVVYTLIGSLSALVLTLLFFPLGLSFLESIYDVISPYVGKFLLFVVLMLLVMSKKFFLNGMVFLVSGLLGLLCFSLVDQTQILLPLLSGLFGTSTLILSLLTVPALPLQETSKHIPISGQDVGKNVSRATSVGLLASFLPGFGSSQAAIVALSTMKKKEPRDYLILVGGINTVNFAFSLVTVTVLGKARNGAIVGVKQLVGALGTSELLLFVPVLMIVGGSATILGIKLSKIMGVMIRKVPYKALVLSVIGLLLLLVVLLSGFQGVLILITATALGIGATQLGGQKNMLLGCLLLPVILYLW